MSIKADPRRQSGVCPICSKPQDEELRPFCSRGCRDRDLLKWLGGDYRMPGPPENHDEDEAISPEQD